MVINEWRSWYVKKMSRPYLKSYKILLGHDSWYVDRDFFFDLQITEYGVNHRAVSSGSEIWKLFV
jgi:hypothetical protein